MDERLAGLERERGLTEGSTRTMLLIESPLGLLNAYAIAASSPRIIAVSFGGEDFSRELGLPLVRTGEAKELIAARSNSGHRRGGGRHAVHRRHLDGRSTTSKGSRRRRDKRAGSGSRARRRSTPTNWRRSTRRSVRRPTKWPTPSGSSLPTRQRSPTARARSTTRAHSWKSRSSRGRGGFSIWRRSTIRPRPRRGRRCARAGGQRAAMMRTPPAEPLGLLASARRPLRKDDTGRCPEW